MAKYLIVTKEKDYISSSRDVKKHMLNTNGTGLMIYDKDGILINTAKKDENGKIITIKGLFDGNPREWAIDFIKNNVVGAFSKDAQSEFYIKNI